MRPSPVDTFYDTVLSLQAEGLKPFQIVKRVLADADAQGIPVTVAGTLNDSQLRFAGGDVISFDGKAWGRSRPG